MSRRAVVWKAASLVVEDATCGLANGDGLWDKMEELDLRELK